jgi:outer membrane protein
VIRAWLAILLVAATAVAAQERIKIGYIDLQRVIVESHAGKRARERLQSEAKRAEAELLKEKQEVERLKGEIDKKGALLKEEDRRNLEREFQRRYLGYQRSLRDSQEELRQREGEMTAEILKEVEKIVHEVGKNEKFTLILERSQLLYSDQGIDITPRVLEIYNSRSAGKPVKGR